MKKALILALALTPLFAFGQNGSDKTTKPTITVSVSAKAADVRGIIADLFSQAKLNYVLQPGIQAALFLQLDKIDFEEALNIICTQAKLQYEVQNGIYFISKKPTITLAAPPPVVKGTLDKSVLTHKITAKLSKTNIRIALTEFGKQASVTIEVDKNVPNFKLDATLTHATLKFALDKVTEAAGLKYKFTDTMSILIFKPDDGNKVSISG